MAKTTPAAPLVAALTVNWNRPADTLECLASLASQTWPNLYPLVVDNGSTDGSAGMIAGRFPDVALIACPENLGFAGGFNLGMRRALEAGAEYVFILNNDAVLAPDGIAALMQHAAPDRAILAPLIYTADPPDRIWSLGGRTSRWTLEKSDDFSNQRDPGGWPPVLEQDFVTGCGMLFSRRALEQVGMFDEGFHMYYEDSDLSYRTRQAGYSITVVPAAHMWHKVATSSGGADSPAERYWMARSSLRFFRKHARGLQIPAIVTWRLGSALRTSWRLLRSGRRSSLAAYWRGLWDGLRTPLNTHTPPAAGLE